MIKIYYRTVFKKDTKRAEKRGKDLKKLKAIIELLVQGEGLPKKNKDHALTGNYINHRECHIEPDWLLIYKLSPEELILERTGTHADLFKK